MATGTKTGMIFIKTDNMNRFITTLIVAAALMFASCAKEDIDKCFGRVLLRISINAEETKGEVGNDRYDRIDSVRVYVFDATTGKYVTSVGGKPDKSIKDEPYEMILPIRLMQGNYRFATWT